mgnify:CR=1 FL=1
MVNRSSVFSDTIQKGQLVRCSLPFCGYGIVVAIHGEQSPESCKSIGGIGVAGGNATIDIVWDNGNRSNVPETLARSSVQWEIFSDVVGAQEVADAVAMATKIEQEKADAQERADRAREAAKAELASDPALRTLKRADKSDDHGAKLAAANLRKLLKIRFPGVKFSVRMDGYSAIRVRWEDGPTRGEVETQAQKFKRGYFDGMTDSYEFQRSPWVDLFGGVEYVFCERSITNSLMGRAIDAVWCEFSGNVKDMEKPTPEGIRSGRFTMIEVPGIWEPVSRLVNQKAAEMAG